MIYDLRTVFISRSCIYKYPFFKIWFNLRTFFVFWSCIYFLVTCTFIYYGWPEDFYLVSRNSDWGLLGSKNNLHADSWVKIKKITPRFFKIVGTILGLETVWDFILRTFRHFCTRKNKSQFKAIPNEMESKYFLCLYKWPQTTCLNNIQDSLHTYQRILYYIKRNLSKISRDFIHVTNWQYIRRIKDNQVYKNKRCLYNHTRDIKSSYGHTHQKAPDPVRSPKLSWWWRRQYCGGGPHGNTTCCSFFIFFATRYG